MLQSLHDTLCKAFRGAPPVASSAITVPRARSAKYLFALKGILRRAHDAKLSAAQMLIHLSKHSQEQLKSMRQCRGLFPVFFYELPVRVNLESGLFTVGFDEDLVVPPAIGIVFP